MLSPKVVEKLKLATLDTLAAILSGVSEAVTQKIVPFATVPADRAEASILGFTVRGDLRSAALANGTMAHACDYDDSSWTMWVTQPPLCCPLCWRLRNIRIRLGVIFSSALLPASR
jgi:2-methylcitrate dehydratase PrpD